MLSLTLPAAASATIILGDPPANEDVAPKADGAPEPSAAPGQRSSTPIRTSSHDVPDGPDGVSIHTTDGRVKNPVPSKLKGKADNKNGNFGVMHIDINSSQAALRNAAAKRTSEETEAAARLANMRGYQSIKRSKLAWNPQSESDPRSSAPAYGASQNGHLNSSYSLPGRPLGPLPHEAKAEQARLLTLLRTLNPMVVVDQLCKALAYFGGIPGAPSSHEFDFPDSGRNNGQGSIFVGWVAEIFPPVEGNPSALAPHPSLQSADIASAAAPTAVVAPDASAPASAQAPALSDFANTAALPAQPASTAPLSEPAPNPPDGQNATGEATTTPIKRPRGRPKGSKSSKPRIDKGMKKSDLALLSSSQQVDGTGSQLSQSDLGRRPDGSYDQSQNGLANPAYHGDMPGHLDPDSSIMSTPGTGKKRGRPKGSKNRPKNTPEAGQATAENPHALMPASSTSNPITLSPLSHKATETQNSISSFANTMPPRSEQHQHPSPTLPESVAIQHTAHMASRAPPGSQPAYPASSSWAGAAMQSLDQFRSVNNHSHSKKRKGGDAAQVARESLATIAAADPSSHMRQGDDTPLHGITSDQTNIKRRRVSRESHQNPIFNNIDSQPGRVGMTTSPVLSNNYNSISQTMASTSFDTQLANASAAVRQVSNQQHLQQQQQQQHHHHHSQRSPTQPQGQTQPQPQPYAPQRPHPQSAGMRPPLQLGHLPPGSSRPRAPSQLYGSSPTSISPQGFYNQARQLPGQLGHAATNSGSFARGTGNKSQQPSPFGSSSSNMARQSSGDARTASLSQQASLAISRSQSGHTPTARHASSSDFASSQQVPATSASAAPSTSGLGHFPAFAEHSYLDMDYGLNERDVQDSAAAFGDSTPIDVTLVEPNIRGGLYQAMSRP
ncbi:hypothetical protein ACQKWADRAFT_284746 [Trichoderma austrokoningii]